MPDQTAANPARERITRLLVVEIFLVFFLGWMIAPLLPRLASNLGTSVGRAGILIPAYAIPYGCVCLLVGPIADRFGARPRLAFAFDPDRRAARRFRQRRFPSDS